MNINVGEFFNESGDNYIVLTVFDDNGSNYVFANRIDSNDEMTTEDYYLFKVEGTKYTKLIDENEINRLFPKVQEGLKKVMIDNGIDINELNKEG